MDESGDLALFEGSDGSALVYSISEKEAVHTLKFGKGHITDAVWWGARPIISTSTGAVKIFEKEKEIGSFAVHAGSATGLALHPTGDLLASVGSDKSYVVYDLESMSHVTRVFTDSGMYNSWVLAFLTILTLHRAYLRPIPSRRRIIRSWW